MPTRTEAVIAKQKMEVRYGDNPGVISIGVGHTGGTYTVAIEATTDLKDVPDEIDGVPVYFNKITETEPPVVKTKAWHREQAEKAAEKKK